jgi:hypothetical protein
MDNSEAKMIGGVGREMTWQELPDAQKIERMREIVKRLMRQVERLDRTARSLRRHSHNATGEVVVSFGDHYDGEPESSGRSVFKGEWF